MCRRSQNSLWMLLPRYVLKCGAFTAVCAKTKDCMLCSVWNAVKPLA